MSDIEVVGLRSSGGHAGLTVPRRRGAPGVNSVLEFGLDDLFGPRDQVVFITHAYDLRDTFL